MTDEPAEFVCDGLRYPRFMWVELAQDAKTQIDQTTRGRQLAWLGVLDAHSHPTREAQVG